MNIIIYFTVGALFGAVAAITQKKKFPKTCAVEMFITFFANGILWPLIIGFGVAKVLKGDKVVYIPKL